MMLPEKKRRKTSPLRQNATGIRGMAAGGWSRYSRHLVNGLFALANPVGVLLFHFGASQSSINGQLFLGSALAFAAGTFLCIATSDLLPELQFHSHDRGKLSLALLA